MKQRDPESKEVTFNYDTTLYCLSITVCHRGTPNLFYYIVLQDLVVIYVLCHNRETFSLCASQTEQEFKDVVKTWSLRTGGTMVWEQGRFGGMNPTGYLFTGTS